MKVAVERAGKLLATIMVEFCSQHRLEQRTVSRTPKLLNFIHLLDNIRYVRNMDDLSFTTFLKLGLLPTTQGQLGQLQRMLASERGYDFYKQMKFAAKEVALGQVPPEEIMKKLEAIPRKSERDHNILMANNFLEWWNSQKNVKALSDRPSGVFKKQMMSFGIKMRPELAYEKDGSIHVVYLWATKSPKITNQAAGVGIYLLQEGLRKGNFKNAKFSILNLRTGKILSDNLVTNQSATLAAAEISLINELWKSCK